MKSCLVSSAFIALAAAAPISAQQITITAAGGDYGAAIREAMWGPAAQDLGYEVREESQSDSLAALRMQVMSSDGGLDRAISRIEKLKPDVAIWWSAGAQSTQILKDGEVDLVVTWNGRAANAAADGGAAAYTFKGSVIGTDCLAVPVNAPNPQDAMKLIASMTQPERVARLTDHILYGPVNPAAYETGLIPEERLEVLATAPANAGTSVFSDPAWWVENGEAAQIAFDEMINR